MEHMEIFRRIKDNNLDYFKDNIFSQDKKVFILEEAVSQGKLDIIRFYMDSGIPLTATAPLLRLMATNRKTGILDYLESQGIDLTQGGHILLLRALEEKNIKFAGYLLDKVEGIDDAAMTKALQLTHQKFKDTLKVAPLIKNIVKHISSDAIHQILDSMGDKKAFIFDSYLSAHVHHKNEPSKKIKI